MEHVKNQKYAYLNNQVEKLAEKSHEMRTYIKVKVKVKVKVT